MLYRLTDIGPLCNYPHSLKQLDVSHNQIENWPPFSSWDILSDEPMSPISTSSPFLCSSPTVTCFAGIDRNSPKTPVIQGNLVKRWRKFRFHCSIFRKKIS